jgi:hypothetical protein
MTCILRRSRGKDRTRSFGRRASPESLKPLIESGLPPRRRTAERLLRTHPLRAADILQLSAALIVADHDPSSLEMVCLDDRLTFAARRAGFIVLGA